MEISNPKQDHDLKESQLDETYKNTVEETGKIDEEEQENDDQEVLNYGLSELKKKRLIPLGKIIHNGKPFFMQYPEMTKTTYNVFTFVGPMGSAKTLLPSTSIITKEYGLLTIQELHDKLHEGSDIHVYSLIPGKKPRWSKVKDAWITENEELYEVKVFGGAKIHCSMKHKILTWDKGLQEKRLRDLLPGNRLIFPKKIDIPEQTGNTKLEELALFAGIFLADGYSSYDGFSISNWKLINQLRKILKTNDVPYGDKYINNCYHLRAASQKARDFFKEAGFEGAITSKNKTVPSWIFQNKAYLRKFLQGIIECDGSFITKKPSKDRKGKQKTNSTCHQIQVVLKTKKLIQAVVYALMAFGIKSTWEEVWNRATNGKENAKPLKYYEITISDRTDLKTYLHEIGIISDYTKARTEEWNLDIESNIAYLDERGMESDVDEIRWMIENYHVAKIESINPIGPKKAYDIEVEDENFLAGEGCGMFVHNSTNVRSMIYYSHKFDPNQFTIIFDPMKMEYSKLSVKATGERFEEKKSYLLNETMFDDETGKPIQIEIEPDSLPVFHLIPRFAIKRRTWNDEEGVYENGFDNTTLEIMRRDGGFIWAEDISSMTEDQLFNCLNYREIKQNQVIHFYLRTAMRICNNRWGRKNWYVGDLIDVLREGVKRYRSAEEVESVDETEVDKKTGLSNNELQLIEQIEKFNDVGFFVRNKEEKRKYSINFRKFIRIGKILNISFMGFKKTEKVGEDLVVGQTDLILERLIEISNEYYDAVRKKEDQMPITGWEEFLLRKWKVSLWFEESEVYIPRDCPQSDIKKWPCIKRLDYLMSFGRKYGFKNFGFITQRIQKVNPMIFKDSNNIFLGPLIGEERDKILSDFGVSKTKFQIKDKEGNPVYGPDGKPKMMYIKDIVSTLRKEKHEWLYIGKAMQTVAPIGTFDSPCG